MRSVIAGLCLCSVVIAVASLYLMRDDVSVAVPGSASPPEIAVKRTMPTGQAHVMPPASAMPQPTPSMAAQVDRLTATGKPEDALKAFQLTMPCKFMQYRKRFGSVSVSAEELESFCGDITQLQLRETETNLNKAVAAEVPGALTSKRYYGPHGNGHNSGVGESKDPFVVEWRDGMLRDLIAYAKVSGDTGAMDQLALYYYGGALGVKSRELAFGYMIAMERLNAQSTDPERQRLAQLYPASRHYMADGLTAQQAAAALAFANKFLAECCKKRQ